MDKANALDVMQGNASGHGKGLSTYPTHADAAQRETHAACLELEREGYCVRHVEGVSRADGQPDTPYVIWMPVAAGPKPATHEPDPAVESP